MQKSLPSPCKISITMMNYTGDLKKAGTIIAKVTMRNTLCRHWFKSFSALKDLLVKPATMTRNRLYDPQEDWENVMWLE